MTFRTRTAPKPTRRRTRRDDTRRAIYTTIAFTLAIACALALLGGVFAANWYSDHWAPIGAVNGQVFSKDAVRDRANLDVAIYNEQLANYSALRNQAKITSSDYSTLSSTIQTNTDPSKIYSNALTELINQAEIEQYASQNGITVTDAQVDAQIKLDATIPEMRHVMIIGVQPEATPPASSPTAADLAAAQTKADGYLKEVQGGKAWATVATEANITQTGATNSVGDIGLVTKDQLNVDPDLADAIFALAKTNDVTAVFKGTDGAYRFATVTTILPSFVDPNWQSAIDSASSSSSYRAYAKAEATQKAVQNSIEAKYITGPTVQRNVLEIAIGPGYGQVGDGDEVKISIMVFAPNHSESDASSVVTTDPAWTDALSRANAAVATLRADPSKFASMAADTTVNDDTNWDAYGGSIPWIPSDLFNSQTNAGSQGLGLTNVQAKVFDPSLTPGTVLDPIQEPSQGYVVVLFQGRRPAPDQRIADAMLMINAGTDFATEAEQASQAADAASGGNLGWVSPYMLNSDQQAAIWQTPVGGVSNIVSDSNGYWIYKVLDQQTRTPDATQQAKLKGVVYSRWLAAFQANALVWQDSTALTAMAPASPTP
ncbi:MAG: peptidylprolyl isomerase [Candidatus Limnocylindrales bacterium]|jgi:parvulin-like peptidyl-prolyl isomerase